MHRQVELLQHLPGHVAVPGDVAVCPLAQVSTLNLRRIGLVDDSCLVTADKIVDAGQDWTELLIRTRRIRWYGGQGPPAVAIS